MVHNAKYEWTLNFSSTKFSPPTSSILTSELLIRSNVQETGLHQLMKTTTLGEFEDGLVSQSLTDELLGTRNYLLSLNVSGFRCTALDEIAKVR